MVQPTRNNPDPEGRKATLDPERWVDAHADCLYRYAIVRTGNTDTAEDLVQETFLAALSSRDTFKGGSSERTWLVGILRNKIFEYFRKTAAKAQREISAAVEDTAEDPFAKSGHWKESPMDWKSDPEQEMNRLDLWSVFRRCIQRLGSALADTFLLSEIEALSSEKICKQLEISENALWSRMHRARLNLRKCMEKNWYCETKESSG